MYIKLLKLFVSCILILCLFDMPYGYYQFVRFASMIAFVYLAFLANKQNDKSEVFVYIGLVILFQPFVKIALGRIIWNIVDLIVGLSLILSISDRKAKNKI
jgi:hypothetical protein